MKRELTRGTPSDPIKQATSRVTNEGADEASVKRRLAIGTVLAFYRQIRQMSRPQLASKTGISAGLIGLIENGVRLPTRDSLAKIGMELGLNSEQNFQLLEIAGYSPRSSEPEAPGWEVIADDVLHGYPVFLRNSDRESRFQDSLDFEEAWVVTRRPMALHEPVLSTLRGRLLNSDARYVYFVDRLLGEEDFKTLWLRLNLSAYPGWVEKNNARRAKTPPPLPQLVFVLSPPTLCGITHTLAIFNPRSKIKPKFGRTAFYLGDSYAGVYAMDRGWIKQTASLLMDIYFDCERHPGEPVPQDPKLNGSFTLISAETLGLDT